MGRKFMCDAVDVGFSQAHITIPMYLHTCVSDTPLDSMVGVQPQHRVMMQPAGCSPASRTHRWTAWWARAFQRVMIQPPTINTKFLNLKPS